jgi:signal transduction histidine kinase
MRGMTERASLVGATLDVTSDRNGGGCLVSLDVPLNGVR